MGGNQKDWGSQDSGFFEFFKCEGERERERERGFARRTRTAAAMAHGQLPKLAHNARPGAPADVPGDPVSTDQQAEYAVIVRMMADHQQQQQLEMQQMIKGLQ